MRATFSFLLLFSVNTFVSAQNLTIPEAWTGNTVPTGAKSDRIKLAQDVIASAAGTLGSWGSWQLGGILSSMAVKDYIAGTKDNMKLVTDQALQADGNATALLLSDPALDVSLYWAQLAVYGYRAYGDSRLLDLASAAWDKFVSFQVTQSEADAGHKDPFQNAFQTQCNGLSTVGGVPWHRPDSTATGFSAATVGTGNFLILSAHLAELAPDDKYLSAAKLSASFMANHLLNDDIVADGIDLTTTACTLNEAYWASNSGLLLEGFAILADITGDQQWTKQALKTLSAATHGSRWNNQDGIMVEGDGNDYKAHILRNLFELWRRTSDTDVKLLIESYISVQHNALLNNAKGDAANTYSYDWTGPQPQKWTARGTGAALDLLSAGIFAGDTPRPAPGTSTTASTTAPSSRTSPGNTRTPEPDPVPSNKPNTLAIALGVSIPLVLLLAIGIVLLLRRHIWRSSRTMQQSKQNFGLARAESARIAPAPSLPEGSSEKRRIMNGNQIGQSVPSVAVGSSSGPSEVTGPDPNLTVPDLVRLLNQRLAGNAQPDPAVAALGHVPGPSGSSQNPPDDDGDDGLLPPPAYDGAADMRRAQSARTLEWSRSLPRR